MKHHGSQGEELACEFLEKQNFRILERNFRSRFGEIDIIAQEGQTIVFVEVKTRWNQKYGRPEDSITPWKIRAIIKTGQYYKYLHPEYSDSLRVDAVVIEMKDNNAERIELIRNLTG